MTRAGLRGVALAALLAMSTARGHDLITAEVADRYLAEISANQATYRSSVPAARRAEAAYQLGRALDEIRAFLNRDVASHGQVLGLASNRLVLELTARGAPLRKLSDGRFAANLDYYRDALRLDPRGEREGDALFRLLQGYFYDSFGDDPLSPVQQSWADLSRQIDYGERLLGRPLRGTDAEEVRFILLIHYIQAARSAPDASTARRHAGKARTALAEFERLHADSMRAAAVPVLRERLESN